MRDTSLARSLHASPRAHRPDFLKGVNADVEVTISPEELEGLDEVSRTR